MSATMVLAMTAVATASIAQAFVKHGMDRVGGITFSRDQLIPSLVQSLTDIYVLLGFAMVLTVIPLWLAVLARLPLSVAYPLGSIGFVIAVIIGAIFFKETITLLRASGMAFIIIGVVAISRSG